MNRFYYRSYSLRRTRPSAHTRSSEKQTRRARRIAQCQMLLYNFLDFFSSSSCSISLFRTLVNLFAVVNKRGRERANRSERHLIFYKIWHELVLVLIAITIIFFSDSSSLFFYIAVSVNSKPIEMILMFFISCTYSLDWPMLYHHYMLYSPSQALFLALFHKVENLFGWHIAYHHYGVVFL